MVRRFAPILRRWRLRCALGSCLPEHTPPTGCPQTAGSAWGTRSLFSSRGERSVICSIGGAPRRRHGARCCWAALPSWLRCRFGALPPYCVATLTCCHGPTFSTQGAPGAWGHHGLLNQRNRAVAPCLARDICLGRDISLKCSGSDFRAHRGRGIPFMIKYPQATASPALRGRRHLGPHPLGRPQTAGSA